MKHVRSSISDAEDLKYAKRISLKFCQEFYNRLPRELRDIAYQYVSTEDSIWVANDRLAIGWAQYFCDAPATTKDYFGYQLFWNAEYVGEDVKKELAENWYRTSRFNFDSSCQYLDAFLTTDRWGLGLNPSNLVANVGLEINLGAAFDPSSRPGSRGLEGQWAQLSSFKRMKRFKNNTHINILLYLGYKWRHDSLYVKERKLGLALKFIFPSLQALKSAGYRVAVLLDGKKELGRSETTEFSPEGFVAGFVEEERVRLECNNSMPTLFP